MAIFSFQVNSFDTRNEPKKSHREKLEVAPEALDRVTAANLYFDTTPPRAHSQAELDALFKRR